MVEPSMTYLPSPAEAPAAAQRPSSKAVGKAHPKSHAPRSQGSSPARKGGWVAPVLLGSAAALGVAALYTAKMTRDAERKPPPDWSLSRRGRRAPALHRAGVG